MPGANMPSVDISILGDKGLERILGKLPAKVQKKVVRQELRKEAKHTQGRIVSNIDQLDLVDSGKMRRAYARAKIRSAGKRALIRLGIQAPSREDLGIAADDPFYYPNAVEFGHEGAAPKPFQRPAIDEHRGQSIGRIARGIGAGIKREARK